MHYDYVNFLELENVSFYAHGIVYYPSFRLSLFQMVVLTDTGKNIYVAR